MLKIREITCDNRRNPMGLASGTPTFRWVLESDKENTVQKSISVQVYCKQALVFDSGTLAERENIYVLRDVTFIPHTEYEVLLTVTDNYDECAQASCAIFTGKLEEAWTGKWIGSNCLNDKKNSLPPELFHKNVELSKEVRRAILYASALGIYEAECNGKKIGDVFFAPGYTHYQTYLQFQTYDITTMLLEGENSLDITVANGWYLGTIGNKNNNYGNKRGLIAELHIWYADGTKEVIHTDESWLVTQDTSVRYADFYNGEVIDTSMSDKTQWSFMKATVLSEITKELVPHYGDYVREESRLSPIESWSCQDATIFDMGQNHAGVLEISVSVPKGTIITLRHGELVNEDGSLFTTNLRKAKQTFTIICGEDGEQSFLPRYTFMGFRYVELTADKPIEVRKIESVVLTSDAKQTGEFSCSAPMLSKFWENIQWGQRSNFIEIPTDCPQRDERMGWTGDIALFASTAATNRDISSFMKKWLTELRLDQKPNGTLPVTVPEIKTYQPTTFKIPIAIWGDAATMVPWAVYRASGDKEFLKMQYASMKAYTEAERRVAQSHGKGTEKYLWNWNWFQYGDWCAAGESVGQWKRKGKHIATSFYANSVKIMQCAAQELGYTEDAADYGALFQNIQNAFAEHYIKEDGTLKGDFQSNYVCALYFGLVPKMHKAKVAKRLVELVREGKHCVLTGFPGTAYIAFALADNGYVEDAYKLLQNTECPSWLYTVKAGGTTVWERWDALDENGHFQKMGKQTITDMVSFNHYAYGAVGDFYYRRILGLEPVKAGYQEFVVKPIPGGTLTHAKGGLRTTYGEIKISWKIEEKQFALDVEIPVNTCCEVVLPDGESKKVGSGSHTFVCEI